MVAQLEKITEESEKLRLEYVRTKLQHLQELEDAQQNKSGQVSFFSIPSFQKCFFP